MQEVNITLEGGLGNQLFQYALGRNFVERGYHTTFDRSGLTDMDGNPHHKNCPHYGLNGFNTIVEFGKPIGPIFSDHDFGGMLPYRQEVFNLSSPHTLRGHWQCERYFGDAEKLRKELVPKNVSSNARILSEKITSCNSVFLHIRHGDYLLQENLGYHGVMTKDYYTVAWAYISGKVSGITPFIFSDDPEWCKQNLAGEIIEGNSQWEDMWLMSLCKHAVIANSTFSWWGAWLGDVRERIVIAPERWFVTQSLDSRDIIPSRWVKL